jgi:hypothetical protein
MVRITLTISESQPVEAVMLALNRDRMRVAIEGYPDTEEFRLVGDRWLTEENAGVQFDAWISDGADAEEFTAVTPRLSMAAH